MKSYLKISTFLLFLFFSLNGLTQTLTVSPTKVNVTADESFTIEYRLDNASNGNIIAPNLKDFFVVGGPSQFSSFQMVNGRTTSYKTISYELQPKKEGIIIIQPATAKVGNKTLQSPQVRVTVSKAKQPTSNNQQQNLNSKSNSVIPNNGPLFFVAETDTANYYLGQQVTLKYVLYSQYDLTNYNFSSNPSFQGFWVEDITPKRITPTKKTFGDQVYNVYELKKYALFPQKSGEIELEGIETQLTLRQYVNSRNSFFRNYKNVNKVLTCKPLKVNIYQLPDSSKPANFTGAVGQFKCSNRVSKSRCETGEAIDYTVTISGNGNLMLLNAPSPTFPESFDIYEPVMDENIYQQNDEISGSKTFTYTIIPTEKGHYKIDGVAFNYFDPIQKKYIEVNGRNYTMNVSQGEIIEGENEEEETSNFQEIVETTSFKSTKTSNAMIPILGLLYALPFFVLPFLIKKRKQQLNSEKDVIGNKQNRAVSIAKQRLTTAESFKNQGNKKAFYDETSKAILGFISDKLNIETALLNKNNIEQNLQHKGASSELIGKLKQTIEYCEMALYAPVPNADNLEGTYQDALTLIEQLEHEL